MQIVKVDGDTLTLEQARAVAHGGAAVEIGPDVRPKIDAARAYVERIIAEGRVVYGITTGFGKFSDVTIAGSDVLELQRNLILSHCCGVGEPLDVEKTRALMLLRANVLAKGYSGARFLVLETLVEMLNRGLVPVIPSRGSVGASGDLAPLAHLGRGDDRRRRSGLAGTASCRSRGHGRGRHRARWCWRPRRGWPSSTAPSS